VSHAAVVRLSCVAPRAGAWIETREINITSGIFESPLAQGRGLKQDVAQKVILGQRSPLAQGRGLKPSTRVMQST